MINISRLKSPKHMHTILYHFCTTSSKYNPYGVLFSNTLKCYVLFHIRYCNLRNYITFVENTYPISNIILPKTIIWKTKVFILEIFWNSFLRLKIGRLVIWELNNHQLNLRATIVETYCYVIWSSNENAKLNLLRALKKNLKKIKNCL